MIQYPAIIEKRLFFYDGRDFIKQLISVFWRKCSNLVSCAIRPKEDELRQEFNYVLIFHPEKSYLENRDLTSWFKR